jgi:hypothetical protein
MEERKGFLTPDQEKKVDRVIKFTNPIVESLDGPAISIADNQGLERLKAKLVEKFPDALPMVYEIVDAIVDAIPEPEVSE